MHLSSESKAEAGGHLAGLRAQLIGTSIVCAVAVPAALYFLAFASDSLEPALWSGAAVLLCAANLARLLRKAARATPSAPGH